MAYFVVRLPGAQFQGPGEKPVTSADLASPFETLEAANAAASDEAVGFSEYEALTPLRHLAVDDIEAIED